MGSSGQPTAHLQASLGVQVQDEGRPQGPCPGAKGEQGLLRSSWAEQGSEVRRPRGQGPSPTCVTQPSPALHLPRPQLSHLQSRGEVIGRLWGSGGSIKAITCDLPLGGMTPAWDTSQMQGAHHARCTHLPSPAQKPSKGKAAEDNEAGPVYPRPSSTHSEARAEPRHRGGVSRRPPCPREGTSHRPVTPGPDGMLRTLG